MNYSISPQIVERIEQLAAELTPLAEIAVLVDIDLDILRQEFSNKDSPARLAYFRGKAATANALRKIELEFAKIGSPVAVQQTGEYLREMTLDEDF